MYGFVFSTVINLKRYCLSRPVTEWNKINKKQVVFSKQWIVFMKGRGSKKLHDL